MKARLEFHAEALYSLEERALALRRFGEKFAVLTEKGRVYAFDEGGFQLTAEADLEGEVLAHSWIEPSAIGLLSQKPSGYRVTLLNLETGRSISSDVAGQAAGIACGARGLAYWGPGTGFLKGYMGFLSEHGSWKVETPLLQTAALSGDTLVGVALDGRTLKAELKPGTPPAFTTLGKVPGRVRKVIPLPDAVVLVQAKKVVIASEKGMVSYDLAEEARLAKHVGGYVAIAEGTRLHLLDVESWKLSTLEVGRVYDIDSMSDRVYALTEERISIIEDGLEAEVVGLAGVPAALLAAGRGFALYFLQMLAVGRGEPPTVGATVKFLGFEGPTPVYEVQITLKSSSSLSPLAGVEAQIETEEGSQRVVLDQEGRATIRAKVQRPTMLRVSSRGVKATEVKLVPPSAEAVKELARGDKLVRGDASVWYVQEKLGSGGFGTVYRILDPLQERSLAVKLLPMSGAPENVISDLLREAWLLSQASQRINRDRKRVVEVHGFEKFKAVGYTGTEKGEVYGLVMEYVEGGSLAGLISAGTAPTDLKLRIAVLLSESLAKLHEEGIVHGDIKPQNILLRQDTPLLADFGAARIARIAGELLPIMAYTPEYAPPEALKGQLSEKSDVYSLGTVLVELLAGTLPAPQSTNIPSAAIERIRRLKAGGKLLELLSRMRRQDGRQRPSAREVYETLKRLYG